MHGAHGTWHESVAHVHVRGATCIFRGPDVWRCLDAVITVPRAAPTSEMYACVEQISLLEVYCDEQDASVLTFNYIDIRLSFCD